MKRHAKKKGGLLAALALTACLTGSSCIGPFNAWHQVLQWNRHFENKWVGEGIFIGLVLVPVYTLAFWADSLVLNSVEFWGGKNPVPPPKSLEGVLDVTPQPAEVEVDETAPADAEASEPAPAKADS